MNIKIPLSLLIPSTLVLAAMIGNAFIYMEEIYTGRNEIYKDALQHVKEDINRLQTILYTDATQANKQNKRLNFSISALDKNVRNLMLVNEEHITLLSNIYSYEGTLASDIGEYDKQMASSVIRNKKYKTYFSDDSDMLYGYFPVRLPLEIAGGDVVHKYGVIYVKYSLKNKFIRAKSIATKKSVLYGFIILLVSLLISFLLHRLITVRLRKLVLGTKRVASGNLDEYVNLSGADELSKLAKSFNNMMDNLSELMKERDLVTENLEVVNKDIQKRTSQLDQALFEKGEQERILRLALIGSGTGVFIFDFSTEKLFWDEKSLEMFDVNKSEFAGTFNDWVEHVYPDDLSEASAEFQQAIIDKTVDKFSLHYRTMHKDESIYYIRAVIQVERDSSGNATKVYGLHFDDTQLKNEEKILQNAKEAAEVANQAKSDFLQNMSHEIRTPLNGVMGALQLFEKTPLNDKQKKYLDIANLSGKALLNVINDVLDFSKIEAGELSLNLAPFDITKALNEIHDLMSIESEMKGIVFKLTISEDVPTTVIGDSSKIQQVLINLLSNAFKFTEEGSVELYLDKGKNKTIIVGVKDTGIGMSDEMTEKVLSAFNQADTSNTRKYGGLGLGLTICQNLIHQMYGKLYIKSIENEGSNFYFEIPVVYDNYDIEVIQDAQKEISVNIEDNAALKFSGCRLLLVEDNDINQLVALEILDEYGFDTDVCSNGQLAIEAVKNKKYDIVLMDIQMPVLDGLEATKKIRALGGDYEKLPILAMTAHAIAGDSEKSLDAGMNGHLTKPFNINELIGSIAEWVKPSA